MLRFNLDRLLDGITSVELFDAIREARGGDRRRILSVSGIRKLRKQNRVNFFANKANIDYFIEAVSIETCKKPEDIVRSLFKWNYFNNSLDFCVSSYEDLVSQWIWERMVEIARSKKEAPCSVSSVRNLRKKTRVPLTQNPVHMDYIIIHGSELCHLKEAEFVDRLFVWERGDRPAP